MSDLPWIQEAKKHIGLNEFQTGNNPKIMKWAQLIGGSIARDYTADSIPWCGLFVAYVMTQVGVTPVDQPLWALNWNKFGSKLTEPIFGCVITFKRTNGGHVGFAIAQDSDNYFVLGGNQSDSVSITKIAKLRAQAFRWPPGMENFLDKQKLPYSKMANIKLSTNEA